MKECAGTTPGQSGGRYGDAAVRCCGGDHLLWLQVDADAFYDTSKFAIVPMGFCYPGTKKGQGDLPPRPECRAAWHDRLFANLPEIELT